MKLCWPTKRKPDKPRRKVKTLQVECQSGTTFALKEPDRSQGVTADWLISQFPNGFLVEKATGQRIWRGSLLRERSTLVRFDKMRRDPSEMRDSIADMMEVMTESSINYKQAIADHDKKMERSRARREVKAMRKKREPLSTIIE